MNEQIYEAMDADDGKIWISRYQLKSQGFLNTLSRRRTFDGVLLRINGGYGCIHPWPELGDPSIDQCLKDLRGGAQRSIVRRALRCVEYDRVARVFEHSLFDEMEVPTSHATLPQHHSAQVDLAQTHGFGCVKLKMSDSIASEAIFLNQMVREYTGLRWRLDFNESLDRSTFLDFWKLLNDETKQHLDFIEDPLPYSKSIWRELSQDAGVCFAVDKEASTQTESAKVMVIKPAVDEPFLLAEAALHHQQRVILTSYMDHPVGQVFAAWEAARLSLQFPGLVEVCGLQTHHLFEKNSFSEELGEWRPEFKVPSGYGLGFEDQLEALTWVEL